MVSRHNRTYNSTVFVTADRFLSRGPREIGELKKELERQKNEAEEAKKALEDKIAEEMVLKGELDADEVRVLAL